MANIGIEKNFSDVLGLMLKIVLGINSPEMRITPVEISDEKISIKASFETHD